MDPGTIKDLLVESDLKRKRLARKAELARVSRKKKKARMGDLEEEVSKLQSEIISLRAAQTNAMSSVQLETIKKVLRQVAIAVLPALEILQKVQL